MSDADEVAGPTWECVQCGAIDHFKVAPEPLAEEDNRLVTMITCLSCGFKCTDARSET